MSFRLLSNNFQVVFRQPYGVVLGGPEPAPLPADVTIAAAGERWKMRRVWSPGLEPEGPADAEDPGELAWTQEKGDAGWVAGCVWRGWQSMGVVRPPELSEGPRWAVWAWSLTRVQSQTQAG